MLASSRTESSEVVSSYRTYAEAQAAVDYLSDRSFVVERLTIVAADLRLVEQVTGRRGYAGAALAGAISGAVPGAFIGFVFGLFGLVAPLLSGLALAFWGVVIGGLIGAVVGILGHAAFGGRRDFASVTRIDAARYDLMAPQSVAADARRLLTGMRLIKTG